MQKLNFRPVSDTDTFSFVYNLMFKFLSLYNGLESVLSIFGLLTLK